MKIKSDMWQVAGDKGKVTTRGSRHTSLVTQHSERGIALVITLILLSVTLVMAIAFLAISNRERNSVTTSTDTITAQLAADSALAAAQAQIIATINSTTNPYSAGLIVSTNFQNSFGYVPNIADPTNVNYDYLAAGGTVSGANFEQNVANLLYLPRPPVFVVTNQQTGSNEFRYYLDLNRNSRFENTRIDEPNVDNFGNTNGFAPQTGDPQWIGILERPDVTHGPNNKFVSRYAFMAIPANGSLDFNAIHNQVFNPNLNLADGYFRNQGVGSWEINLAAFLTDLNTNQWDPPTVENAANNPYTYLRPGGFANTGTSFEDARALLAYRYAGNYNSLATLQQVLGAQGYTAYANGSVDSYTAGNLMINTLPPLLNLQNVATPWAGADNTNHYFDLPSDLFNTTKITPANFVNHLELADIGNGSANPSTYDRYTFYRMLAQLGTDSTPESGKMNLNYDNLDFNGDVIAGAETNYIPWTPIRFFTNAADRMLRRYTDHWFRANPSNYLATYYNIHTNYYYTDGNGNVHTNDPSGLGLTNLFGLPNVFGLTNDRVPAFGITNIPVLVDGQYVYSPAVQRVLQLAANIYDAEYYTSNFVSTPGHPTFYLPSMFQPVFRKVSTGTNWNVSIANFFEYTGTGAFLTNTYPRDLTDPVDLNSWIPAPGTLVYGVPIIVGAKKGLPNFNQFSLQSVFQVTRKLQLTRQTTADPSSTFKINEMFNCSVSNLLGVECWNSYATNFSRPTTIWISDHILMSLTNDQTTAPLWPPLDSYLSATININNWPSSTAGQTLNANSFIITNLTAIALPTATYRFNTPFNNQFQPIPTNFTTDPVFENPSGLIQPHWGLRATNNLQVVIIDNLSGRTIDYVQLRGPIISRDLTAEILSGTNRASFWFTNQVSSGVLPGQTLPSGVENQLLAATMDSTLWNQESVAQVQQQIDGFRVFVGLSQIYNKAKGYGATNQAIQVPYSPTVTPVQVTSLQANDPLVHYLARDLFDSANGTIYQGSPVNPLITATLNERYQPWGRTKQMSSRISPDTSPWNLALKDPLMWSSDHWDFPTNKFPTAGWLGRVHRGTPWQTVYLKASGLDLNSWMNWTGNFDTNDAVNAVPTEDRLMFDVFTTAINDNATRGQLSINVAANPKDPTAGLAAWSALFSGLTVISNNLPDGLQLSTYNKFHPLQTIPSYTNFIVNPAGLGGANSALGRLVASINSTRTNTALFPQQAFGTKYGIGDILAVPALTVQSPFLNRSSLDQTNYGISDEMYEWLPQQAMSLLRADSSPRYVVYSYGQTLKPAPNGVVTGGSHFQMITNYQVVAETATRAVLQVNRVVTANPDGTLRTNYNTRVEQYNVLPPD